MLVQRNVACKWPLVFCRLGFVLSQYSWFWRWRVRDVKLVLHWGLQHEPMNVSTGPSSSINFNSIPSNPMRPIGDFESSQQITCKNEQNFVHTGTTNSPMPTVRVNHNKTRRWENWLCISMSDTIVVLMAQFSAHHNRMHLWSNALDTNGVVHNAPILVCT